MASLDIDVLFLGVRWSDYSGLPVKEALDTPSSPLGCCLIQGIEGDLRWSRRCKYYAAVISQATNGLLGHCGLPINR